MGASHEGHTERKAIPATGRGFLTVVRRRGSHILWTIGSWMAVRISALRAGRSLHPGRFLALIFVRSPVDPGS
jgi:hypothetical protein